MKKKAAKDKLKSLHTVSRTCEQVRVTPKENKSLNMSSQTLGEAGEDKTLPDSKTSSPVDSKQIQMEEILNQFPTYREQNKLS